MFNQKDVDKKVIIQSSLVGFFIFVVLCLLQILDYSLVHPVTITNIDREGLIEWKIDMVRVDTQYIAITGWAFVLGQEPNNMAVNVVLQNTSTQEAIQLPTILVDREDINEHYAEEIDYSKSGFLSRVNKYFIELEKDSYEILLEFVTQGQVFYIETDEILASSQGD